MKGSKFKAIITFKYRHLLLLRTFTLCPASRGKCPDCLGIFRRRDLGRLLFFVILPSFVSCESGTQQHLVCFVKFESRKYVFLIVFSEAFSFIAYRSIGMCIEIWSAFRIWLYRRNILVIGNSPVPLYGV